MDTVKEFQRRRAKTWRFVRIPMLAMVVGFIVLGVQCNGHLDPGPDSHFQICFIVVFIVMASIAFMTFCWNRWYRCPECEEPIMSGGIGGRSVPINPDSCPNCGARLR
jgi:hypothetical protein